MSSKVTLSKELHSIILFCLYSCTNNDPKIYNHCYTAYSNESYFYNHKTTETTPTQTTITTKTSRTSQTSTAVVRATPTTSLTALIQNRQNVSTSSKNSTGRTNGLLISNLNLYELYLQRHFIQS